MAYPIETRFRDLPVPRIMTRQGAAQSGPTIPFLVNSLDGTRCREGASFTITWDATSIHVSGELAWLDNRCGEIAEDPREHDQLHVMLSPRPDLGRWYRIRVRPTGVMATDTGTGDTSGGGDLASWWGSGADVAVARDDAGWSFDARVPFELLDVPPPMPGETWGFQIFRMLQRRQEDNASWSRMTIGRPDVIERYGELVFDGPGAAGEPVIVAEPTRGMLRRQERTGGPPTARVASSVVKVFADSPAVSELADGANLDAPRGGHDAAQIVVTAGSLPLTGCVAAVTKLRRADGALISPDAAELSIVGYVMTRRPRYTVDRIGEHPDPLLPLDTFDVAANSRVTLWMTWCVPLNTAAGTYVGEVTIAPSAGLPLRVPVELLVRDFALPTTPTLRTAFPVFEDQFEVFYGRPITDEARADLYEFLLRRGIAPTCQYEDDPRPRPEHLDTVIDGGANTMSTGYVREEHLDEWVARVRPYADELRRRGMLELAYVYGFDEVTPPGYGRLRDAYERIGREIPGLPRSVTVGPAEDPTKLAELVGALDIWIPQTDRLHSFYDERRRLGDELWCYVSMWPRRPYANLFIDYTALEHRIMFWQLWKVGASGFLYYCINLWGSNAVGAPNPERETAGLPDADHRDAGDRGARWPEVPWNTFTGPTSMNGDGQLLYPGPDMRVLSSVRMECVRAGIQDYELLAELSRRVAVAGDLSPELGARARELLAVPDEVVAGMTEFTDDPTMLRETRREIGELIELLG